MKTLVIIPTYNEKENISSLIKILFSLKTEDLQVLVVDDNSPDGTSLIVEELKKEFPHRVHLLLRKKKEGLGKAYVAGFLWGLQQSYDVFVEMDADFSHRPEDLPRLLESLEKNDFAVGSRYVQGARCLNRGPGRKIISWVGSLYSRMILGYPLQDWTGGFNAWRRRVLEGMDFSTLRSEGYGFQIELKYKALRQGFCGIEKPIVFAERRAGQSKMSLEIIIEAFYRVWIMRFF